MMIEELMQEEFQAGRAEGIAKGRLDMLRMDVFEILNIRNIMTDNVKHLLENISDEEALKKMLHAAILCSSTEEFLEQFKEETTKK